MPTEAGLSGLGYVELTQHDALKAYIQGHIDQLNTQLMKYETIKKFAILPADLSIETGELTPSQKMKRKSCRGKVRRHPRWILRRRLAKCVNLDTFLFKRSKCTKYHIL